MSEVTSMLFLSAGIAIGAGSGLVLGLSAAARPSQAIELYQSVMKTFNWHVEPIDYDLELRNTKRLGTLLLVLSMILLALLVFDLWYLFAVYMQNMANRA